MDHRAEEDPKIGLQNPEVVIIKLEREKKRKGNLRGRDFRTTRHQRGEIFPGHSPLVSGAPIPAAATMELLERVPFKPHQ